MAKERKNKKRDNIEEQYSDKYGRVMYAYNVMIAGQRYGRKFIYYTREEAKIALAKKRVQLRDEEDGLAPPDVPTVNLGGLRKRAEAEGASKRDLRMLDIYTEKQEDKEATLLVSLLRADYGPFLKTFAHLAPSSQNRYVTRVAGLLRRALKWFKELEAFEWTPPKAERQDDGECGRDRKIGRVELARVFWCCLAPQQPDELRKSAEARHDFYDFIRLRLLTATRPGEILRLTPQKIDWEEKATIVVTKKGRKIKKRPLYFTETAMGILNARKQRAHFFSFSKSQTKTICTKIAEIHNKYFPDFPPMKYGARVEGGWISNDLRRTAATVLESHSDAPYSAVMAVLGHVRTDMTARYTGPELGRIVEAFKKLEAYVLKVDAIHRGLRIDTAQTSHGKIQVSNPVKETTSDQLRVDI